MVLVAINSCKTESFQEKTRLTLREVKAGQNAAYTAVESAAGFQYDALPLRQQRVLPKW